MAGYETNATIVMNAVPGMMTGITTLISGFASINQQFQNITNGISDGFGLVDAAIISTGALVAKLGWDAAQAYGEFEQGMRIVQVVSNQGASAMEELSTAANQFSVQYRTDIDKITEGLQTLGRAGLNNAHEQTEVLQNGLQTAKLEGRELNTVLEEILQNTTLLGGDLRSSEFGEQSSYVNDLLVSTSMTAPITSHDISQTLQYSGGLAATAGANINSEQNKEILTDYMATIAAFAQKGVKGSLAGTALRAFLNKPATQDSSVQEGLAMIKLKPEYLWEDDESQMKPISDQIELITNQMDKLNISQMDRLQIWSKIVGGKMGQQMMKLDSDDIKKLTSDIDKATSSEEMANKSMNTFSQNLKQIEEQGQVAFRGIGENVVRLINPVLPIIQKILEIFSNPIVNFGIFAGGLALVVEAARRLWGVIKAVKDEFMMMRAMATEALQAITASSAAASTSISQLGNIMIGGLSSGLTMETNQIAILNEGLLTTKGLMADIQMQALGLGGGTKLLPGNRYGQQIHGSVIGQETRAIEVPLDDGGSKTVHQRRAFHVFDMADDKEAKLANEKLNALAQQRYSEYMQTTDKPDKLKDENYFRQKTIMEDTRPIQDGRFVYMKGPWERYNPEDNYFNEQEKYAWAVANEKTGTPVSLNEEEEKKMAQAKADAEKELARRRSLGFKGRLKENLGKQLDKFEENGRSILGLDKEMSPNYFPQKVNNFTNGLKGLGTKFLDIKLPFQGDGVDEFGAFRQKKMRYLTKSDIGHLIDTGHLPSYWKDSKDIRELTPQQLNKAARVYWGKQDDPKTARSDAIGQLYNDLYKTESTIRTGLSSIRRGFSNLTNLPTMFSNFKNRIFGGLETSSSNFPTRLEGLGARFQNGLEKGFSGLGSAIFSTRNVGPFLRGLFEKANTPSESPILTRTNLAGGRFQNILERGFVGLGDSIRNIVPTIGRLRTALGTIPDRINTVFGGGFQNALEKGFVGLGNSIRNIVPTIERIRTTLGTVPSRINTFFGGRLQNALERGFTGLGDGIRNVSTSLTGLRGNLFSTKESIIELGNSARDSAIKLRNINASDIKQGIKNILPSGSGIKSALSRVPSIGIGAIGSGLAKTFNGLTKVTTTTIGAVSTITNALGGPLMVAMMAFSSIMSKITKEMQEYGEGVKEAKDQVKEAYSKRSSAENKLKSDYQEQNPDATEEEIGGMALNAYSNMREEMKDQNKWLEKISTDIKDPKRYAYDEEKDDGSYKEVKEETTEEEELQKSIDENTSALYTATAEISVALDKLVNEMNDGIWGLNGKSSELSDKIGHAENTLLGFSEGDSYTSIGGYLKTATQKDSNYPGYTEFPGLFLEDSFDAGGNLSGTLDRLYGADSNNYMKALHSGTKDFLKTLSKSSRDMGRASNSRLQGSMMNDKKSWQMGAKEIAKYESKNKKSVGMQDTKNTRLENLIKKLQIDTGLSRIQVLQGMYLQQMQDMSAIAEQVMVPLIGQTATAAANTMMLGQQEFPFNQGTTNYTYGTMQIAQAISAQLATIAWAKAGEATRNAALADPDNPLHDLAMSTDDGDQFMKEAIRKEEGYDIGGIIRGAAQIAEPVVTGDTGIIGNLTGGKGLWEMLTGTKSFSEWGEQHNIGDPKKFRYGIGGGDTTAMNQILDTFGATTYSALGMPMDKAIKEAQKDRETLRANGENYHGVYEQFAKLWGSEEMAQKILDPYLLSGLGEDEGSGGGGGGGGGGDSGDKDNTGTKKERVDLVLCNKKEIPKLNVNLFKKPPSFTVLNKNFKLRDVKINTQDTPKAVMASIKNAFIDVQKRSDPKIIQDEEAAYDPVEATDGNAVPSGSAKTKTD